MMLVITTIKELMDGLTAMVLRMTPEIHEGKSTRFRDKPYHIMKHIFFFCPTLLMVGRPGLSGAYLSQHQDMQRYMNSVLEIIEDAGHFAPCEKHS